MKKIISTLIIWFTFCNYSFADQEWSFYGCPLLLPDDVDIPYIKSVFDKSLISEDGAFIRGLKETPEKCYKKNSAVNFIKYSDGRSSDKKYDVEETALTCTETSGGIRDGKNKYTMHNIHIDGLKSYLKIGKSSIRSQNDIFPESISTTKIASIDDFYIHSTSTAPWDFDEKTLAAALNEDKVSCYIACTKKTKYTLNRESMDLSVAHYDENDKIISLYSYQCKKTNKKL